MSFELSWYLQNRVVILKAEGILTPEDIQGIFVQGAAMLNDSITLVHFLVDTRTLQKIDNIPVTLKMAQTAPRDKRMGWMIVVGKMNPMIKFGMDFVGLLTKSRYHCVDTMPEALSFLKEIDTTLVASVVSAQQ